MYMEDYISEINGIHVEATPMTRGDYIKYSGSSDILSGIKSLLGSDDEDGYLIIYIKTVATIRGGVTTNNLRICSVRKKITRMVLALIVGYALGVATMCVFQINKEDK